jgi:CDP-paratose 2-epimerase
MVPYDVPWVLLDPTLARDTWNWQPQTTVAYILEEIALFADQQSGWIATSA